MIEVVVFVGVFGKGLLFFMFGFGVSYVVVGGKEERGCLYDV